MSVSTQVIILVSVLYTTHTDTLKKLTQILTFVTMTT